MTDVFVEPSKRGGATCGVADVVEAGKSAGTSAGREWRRYRFQTGLPETIVEDLRASGLRITELSIGLGDAYGLYAVECVAGGSPAELDGAEETWRLTPVARELGTSGMSSISVVDLR